MAGKRISELTEQTGLSSGDFFGVDNAGQTASKKIDQAYFSGQYADMNNILGSKNLMPNNAVTVVLRGVTWTINSDGTIKANGTASGGDSTLYYVSSSNDATAGITIPEGKYTYTCLTSAGSDSTFRSEIYNLTNPARIGWDYGQGVTFTRTAATKVLGSINIRSGQTVTNEIFKPMLRPAAVADPTYVPYAKSNKELTDDVATLNSSLTWTALTPVTGTSSVSLPVNFKELHVVVDNGTGRWIFNILKDELSSSNARYNTGAALQSGEIYYTSIAQIDVSTSTLKLHECNANGFSYTASATTRVYYR